MSWLQTDWSRALPQLWLRIPKHIKYAFGFALLTNFFVFFYELAQFPIGDHDTGYMSGVALLSGGRAGRWFIPFLHMVSGHVQIPVYTQFFAFCTQIAAGMGAVLLWRPSASFLPLFAGGVLVSCMPVVTEFYYYHWMAPAFTCSQLFMVLSLHCAYVQNAPTANARGLGISYVRWIGAIVLATCAMASYQSSVITWAVCFCGLCAMRIWQWDASLHSLKKILLRLCPPLVSMVIACVLYSLSLRLYPLVGLTLELYQFETIKFVNFLPRLLEVVYQAYIHLWTAQPFMPPYLKALLLSSTIAGFAWFLWENKTKKKKNCVQVVVILLLALLLPVAAKVQFLISANDSWHSARFAGMGLSYVHLFFLLVLFSSTTVIIRNLGLAFFILLLPAMAINCLNEQVQLVRSNLHDFSVLNRVVARLEHLEGYDPDKTYNLVQLGRTQAYKPHGSVPATWGTLHATVSQAWNPGFELWLLSSYLKLGERLNEEAFVRPDLLEKAVKYVEDKKPFPHHSFIGIVDDTIILYFDEKAIPFARKILQDKNN